MARERIKLSDQIRRAVDESGLSRYRIAKALRIAESTMSRFMAGSGMESENIDGLAELLDLNIQQPRKIRKSKGK